MFSSARSMTQSTGQIIARLRRLLTWRSQTTLHNLDLLFKNAPWNAIRERIAQALRDRPACGDAQRQADRLMQVVLEAVNALTPKAKLSPYAKWWWTKDLTKLRQVDTYWRNRAHAQRRAGATSMGGSEGVPRCDMQAIKTALGRVPSGRH